MRVIKWQRSDLDGSCMDKMCMVIKDFTVSCKEMAEASVCNHKYNQNIYSRNIQYKVYHHRIFTSEKLLNEMKIIDNDSCLKCQLPDSIGHLLINL